MMKNAVLLFLGMATIGWSAQASQRYSCQGVYDNKGTEVELTLKGNYYRVKGTTTPGSGFSDTIDCHGTYDRSSRDNKYDVYTTDTNDNCTANYVKIMKDLDTQGDGMLVLARTSGADEHDYSGYSYCYYHCTQK